MPPSQLIMFALLGLAACAPDQPRPHQPAPGIATMAVDIHAPARLTSIATGELDGLGRPLRVACMTCHSLRREVPLPTSTAALDEFHQGLRFAHGQLSCASCHLAGPRPRLHRADGSAVDLADAIALCRDCHGPQARDYDHGAHGGMTGAWDLSTGGRTRNHCVDCHDPHAPAFPSSYPVLPPRDRGLVGSRQGSH